MASPESMQALKDELKEYALSDLALDAFGVAPVSPMLRRSYYLDWIASGQNGTMKWMGRNNDRRLYPENHLRPGANAGAIIVVGLNYFQPEPVGRDFRLAKYALGKDYHKLIYKRLKRLCDRMREAGGEQKPYVDTGPVLEKPIAVAAGIGWQGKSTIVLNRANGTWLFLGTIITTLELPPDEPARDHCGTCTRCISGCPTNAITAPYQLDAAKCISYYTIEHDGPIPEWIRPAIGDRVYGCDTCLDVCPWNRFAQQTREARFAPVELKAALESTLDWSEADFSVAFTGSAVRRLGLRNWKRNVCVVLGNQKALAAIPRLEALAAGDDSLLSEHAGWALARMRE